MVLRRRSMFGYVAASVLGGCTDNLALPTFSVADANRIHHLMASFLGNRETFNQDFNQNLRSKMVINHLSGAEGVGLTSNKEGASDPIRPVDVGGIWRIYVGAHTVAGAFKHLYVVINSADFDMDVLRFDGMAIDLAGAKDNPSNGQLVAFSLSSSDTLIAAMSNHGKSPVNLGPTGTEPRVTVFEGCFSDIAKFVSVASQFCLEVNTLELPYSLLSVNSNTIARSILEYGLGEQFNLRRIKDLFSEQQWLAPGFDIALLRGVRFDRSFGSKTSSKSEAVTSGGMTRDFADDTLFVVEAALAGPRIVEDAVRRKLLRSTTGTPAPH